MTNHRQRIEKLEGRIGSVAKNDLLAAIAADLLVYYPFGLRLNDEIPEDFDLEAWRQIRAERLKAVAELDEPDNLKF
jgi:hypothetical protein